MSQSAPDDANHESARVATFDDVLGQPSVVRALRRAVAEDRVASAYLFFGPSGVGKQIAARALATSVVAGSDPAAAQRIADGNHPDVRVFRPREEGNRNIQVDFLRKEILPLAQFAPFETDKAFFVFPDADVSFPDTQPEAANAILKTLEEPRPGVHFILTAARATALLPTIQSRCQSIRFSPLDDETLLGILSSQGIDPALAASAVALSGGRADVALQLAQDDLATHIVELVLQTDEVIQKNHPGALLDSAEQLARHPHYPLALRTLQALYRDMAVVQLGGNDASLAISQQADEVRTRAQKLTACGAAARVARIHETVVALRQNANPQLAADALLFDLKRLR